MLDKQQVININLSTRLAPVLEQAIDLTPNISNHIRYNVVSSSSSIYPSSSIKCIYVAAAQSSAHYPGETAIRIDSYPAGGVFLTQTQAYRAKAALGHLWYNPGIVAPSCPAPSGSPLCQVVNLT